MKRSHYRKHKHYREWSRRALKRNEVVIDPVEHEWEQYAVLEDEEGDGQEDSILAASRRICTKSNGEAGTEKPDDTEGHRLKKENLLLRRQNKELIGRSTGDLDLNIKMSVAAEQKAFEKEEFEKYYHQERAERKLLESLVDGHKGTITWQAGEIKRLKKYEQRVEEMEDERFFKLKQHVAEKQGLLKMIREQQAEIAR